MLNSFDDLSGYIRWVTVQAQDGFDSFVVGFVVLWVAEVNHFRGECLDHVVFG